MIDSIQTVCTLLGLVADMLGVFMLAREFIEVSVGGVRKLITIQRKKNLAYAAEAIKARKEALDARANGAGWFTIFSHERGPGDASSQCSDIQ